jgi:protein O-mannosyl-transferase
VVVPSPETKSASFFSAPEKRTTILCLLLIVACLGLYNSVTGHPFVNFDDDRYITNNFHVRAGLSWHTVVWAFTTYDQANWHPLTWLSHALDCQLFHLNPAGHHYVNVLFHALNVVLLFLLLQRVTGATWRSLMVAALFAVHPVNVESVAWVAERKNLLSMMFFLLALWTYGFYARKPRAGPYLAVVALFACGLMAKPMVITFPFVLLLWDYWPLNRLWPEPSAEPSPYPAKSLSWLVLEKIPLLALSAGSAIVTMQAQRAGGAVRTIAEYSLPVRLENALVAYARYVVHLFWPVDLAPMYPHPGESIQAWQAGLAALFLLGVTVLVVMARKKRYLAVGWFLFLGVLVPMIGLVQVGAQAMADRYAYLPYVGLFLMICWGIADWAKGEKIAPKWLAAAAAVALIALSFATYRQLGYWSDNVTLWTRTLQVTQDNYVAQDNLGGALVLEGKVDQAMPHFRAAVAINPSDPVANLNIATNLQQHGNLQEAVARYQVVLRMTQDATLRANTLSNLGAAYRQLGDDAQAKESYESALRYVPETPHANIGLGLLAQKTGDFNEAARQYARAVAIQPTDLDYLLLAQALKLAGHPEEAQLAYQQASALSQDMNRTQEIVSALLRK